jgi:hypothetical protein
MTRSKSKKPRTAPVKVMGRDRIHDRLSSWLARCRPVVDSRDGTSQRVRIYDGDFRLLVALVQRMQREVIRG